MALFEASSIRLHGNLIRKEKTMSTRAMYTFTDDRESFHVYKHHDGYPLSDGYGGLAFIQNAIPYAWNLPRFEAAEFAAAFVAANKRGIKEHIADMPDMKDFYEERGAGGDIDLMPQGTINDVRHGDLEYRYEITSGKNDLHVKVFHCDWNLGGKGEWNDKLLFDGTLKGALKWGKANA